MRRRRRFSGKGIGVHRVLLDNVVVTNNATSNHRLLSIVDAPSDTLRSDGTNIAQAESESRLLDIKLQGFITNANSGVRYKWILLKNPDNDYTADVPTRFLEQTDDINARHFRKHILAMGWLNTNSNTDAPRFKVFIRRSALRRVQFLHDGDDIQLWIHNTHATSSGALFLWGRLTTKK